MKDEIRSHIDNPAQLERLYRTNKTLFRREFNEVYPELKDSLAAAFWHERLNYQPVEARPAKTQDLLFLAIASLLAGLVAKLPDLAGISQEYFYPRNIGFIVFPFLAAYFAWKNGLSAAKKTFLIAATAAAAVFINILPDNQQSDTLALSCIHLALVLWCLLGFAFVGEAKNNVEKRLGYLK